MSNSKYIKHKVLNFDENLIPIQIKIVNRHLKLALH